MYYQIGTHTYMFVMAITVHTYIHTYIHTYLMDPQPFKYTYSKYIHFAHTVPSRRSEVMYKAKKVNSITFQRFHCLTLDVQSESHGKKAGGPLSISSCLDLYFREEVCMYACVYLKVLTPKMELHEVILPR